MSTEVELLEDFMPMEQSRAKARRRRCMDRFGTVDITGRGRQYRAPIHVMALRIATDGRSRDVNLSRVGLSSPTSGPHAGAKAAVDAGRYGAFAFSRMVNPTSTQVGAR